MGVVGNSPDQNARHWAHRERVPALQVPAREGPREGAAGRLLARGSVFGACSSFVCLWEEEDSLEDEEVGLEVWETEEEEGCPRGHPHP